MNLQFGGPAIGPEVAALLLISLISVGVSLVRVALRREPGSEKNTELSTEPVANAV
ncbi:hypothetical protein D3C87_2171510 [compost metagenome]